MLSGSCAPAGSRILAHKEVLSNWMFSFGSGCFLLVRPIFAIRPRPYSDYGYASFIRIVSQLPHLTAESSDAASHGSEYYSVLAPRVHSTLHRRPTCQIARLLMSAKKLTIVVILLNIGSRAICSRISRTAEIRS